MVVWCSCSELKEDDFHLYPVRMAVDSYNFWSARRSSAKRTAQRTASTRVCYCLQNFHDFFWEDGKPAKFKCKKCAISTFSSCCLLPGRAKNNGHAFFSRQETIGQTFNVLSESRFKQKCYL